MQVFATMSTPFISEEYNDTDDNFCKSNSTVLHASEVPRLRGCSFILLMMRGGTMA